MVLIDHLAKYQGDIVTGDALYIHAKNRNF